VRYVLRESDDVSAALVLPAFADPHEKTGGRETAKHLLHNPHQQNVKSTYHTYAHFRNLITYFQQDIFYQVDLSTDKQCVSTQVLKVGLSSTQSQKHSTLQVYQESLRHSPWPSGASI
jgi:hypothetical protein